MAYSYSTTPYRKNHHTDENEIINWHFDHSKNRSVKGVNLLNCVYHADGVSLPVAYEIIHKPIVFTDTDSGQRKRRSEVSKNELMRRTLRVCENNVLRYRYVLADSWFSSKENMTFIRRDLKRHFVIALKSNRTATLSYEEKLKGGFERIDELALPEGEPVRGWLRGLGLSGSADSLGLYEQGRKQRYAISGLRRVVRWRRGHLRDLPQKVGSGDVSQDAQEQRGACQSRRRRRFGHRAITVSCLSTRLVVWSG